MKALVLVLALAATASAAQEVPLLEALGNGTIERRDIRISASDRNADAPVLWTGELTVPEAPWLRVLLRTEGTAFPNGSHVVLFTADGARTDLFLAEISAVGYWSDLLPFGRVRIALIIGEGTLDPTSALVIDSIAYQATELLPYSAHGTNQILGINARTVPDDIRRLGKPIAFLSFLSGGRPKACTGFLIGRDLLMTNEHCINSDESCRTLSAAFGYEVAPDGRLQFGRQFRCSDYDPRLTNFELDVTAIQLKGAPGDDFGIIDIDSASDDSAGPMVIVQHSGLRPKEVSLADCSIGILPVDGRGLQTDFTHTCDTAKGTSGAPVLDLAGHFRGLHHFGFNDAANDLWKDNRGVRATLIRDWLAAVLDNDHPAETGPVKNGLGQAPESQK